MTDHPDYAHQLSADDPRMRATAATVLGRLPRRWPCGLAATLSEIAHNDTSPDVRSAALSAVARRAHASRALRVWRAAARDDTVQVRSAAARLATAITVRTTSDIHQGHLVGDLLHLVHDTDGLVAEAACFSLGEIAAANDTDTEIVQETLQHVAGTHDDALVRESAVAALGSLAHESALPIILAACNDKPAVRRRAVLALASYEGAEVDAAISNALTDSDWQVRQAAEDLSD